MGPTSPLPKAAQAFASQGTIILILDGNIGIGAHVRSNLCYLIETLGVCHDKGRIEQGYFVFKGSFITFCVAWLN